jgi:hypothetical protein
MSVAVHDPLLDRASGRTIKPVNAWKTSSQTGEILADAADCELIGNLGTDPKKREALRARPLLFSSFPVRSM